MLWVHKNYAVTKTRSGLLLSFVPFFPRVFFCSGCFVLCKTSVDFFAYCYFLAFWLCLFVRVGAFDAPRMLVCPCLLIMSINTRFSPLPPVFFLLVIIFFTTLKIVSVLAVLLLCFLPCCFGRAVVFLLLFTLFVLLFNSKMHCFGYCVFLLCHECCFCCLFCPVCGVAFFSWFPSVVIRVQQCPPCVLLCPPSPTLCFPPLHNTHMHPSNPCGRTYTLFAHTHMVMSVLVLVRVFAWLLAALCVPVWLRLRLLVGLHLFFVFI